MKKNVSKPPFPGEKILRLFLYDSEEENLPGDLEEIYNIYRQEKGIIWAWLWYWFQVIKFVPPSINESLIWSFTMLRNYLKIAFRNMNKSKSFSFINIFSLALGFTCCIIIFLFVQDELSYDRFHKNSDRIYRLKSDFGYNNVHANSSMKVGELLKENYGEIEELVRINPWSEILKYDNKRIQEKSMAIVDEGFFNMFSYNLIKGDKNNVLNDPYTVVIDENAAKRYFGKKDPIGKVFEVDDGEYQLTVTGLMEAMPSNSHFHFEFIVSIKTGLHIFNDAVLNNVGEHEPYIYLMLPENYGYERFEAKLPGFVERTYGEGQSKTIKLNLQKLTDIHLTSHTRSEIEANSDITHIYGFNAIAVIALILACINYMNLAAARSANRAREVGMRKVLGAHKRQLISQFLGESLLIAFSAMVLSVIFVYLLLPGFNSFTGKELHMNLLSNIKSAGLLLFITFFIGLAAGSYPAFFLSAFQPLRVLKGFLTRGNAGTLLRKSLVTAQFGISIILIIGTFTIFNQLDFLRNKKLGIKKDHLIVMPMQTMQRSTQYPAFKNELLNSPDIICVTAANKRTAGRFGSNWNFNAEGFIQDPKTPLSIKVVTVDIDYFKTFENEFFFGRDFDSKFVSDANEAVIINESARKLIGWKEPVGKWFESPFVNIESHRGSIIGVVKDFHYESLYHQIRPAMFVISESWLNWMYIKIESKNIPQTVGFIKNTFGKFVTDREFKYTFLAEDVQNLYVSEDRFLKVFGTFTGLAIIIACLGIFGLASFTAEKRTREIGIRKVLGATVKNIVTLLIKEFTYLVLLSNIIAWPAAYYFMNKWLQGFVYKTDINLSIFFIAASAALIIAVTTVIYQALKAGFSDPAKAIKYE